MKILLDECVPWPMRKLLAGHNCATAQLRGWGGIENGQLLGLAEGEYDLFITSDQNVRYQQSLTGRKIAILELSTNDLRRIEAAASAIRETVNAIQPGDFMQPPFLDACCTISQDLLATDLGVAWNEMD